MGAHLVKNIDFSIVVGISVNFCISSCHVLDFWGRGIKVVGEAKAWKVEWIETELKKKVILIRGSTWKQN